MGPKIFSLHSYKGGVGKTTVSFSIAALLAESDKNVKVCLIDFDSVGPSVESIIETQLKGRRLHLPYWFDPDSGSPPLDPYDIGNYIWSIRKTDYQKKVLKGTIDFVLCPPTSLGAQAMDRAFDLLSRVRTAWERTTDLFIALGKQGYTHIVIDNTPGFKDFSLLIFSIMSGLGSTACRIIVSSPAYSDVGGVIYQLDSLVNPLNTDDTGPLFWIINFLHGEHTKRAPEYESFRALARLIEELKVSSQTELKLVATLPDQINYDVKLYSALLARMCFVAKNRIDWMKGIWKFAPEFKNVIDSIASKETKQC